MADLARNDLWPEDPKGGSLIPLTRDAQGQLAFSWPNAIRGAVNDVYELVTAPGNALHGRYTPSEMTAPAVRMAMTLAGLGLGAPAAGATELRMFGGIRAKTANMEKLTHALGLEGRGSSPQDIHAATGWFRGPDNQWRFEIPDSEAMLHGQNVVGGKLDLSGDFGHQRQLPLEEVLYHPDLYTAYPQLKHMDVTGIDGPGKGAYYPGTRSIELGKDAAKNALSTTLHETQHAIQDHEGFAEGGNPDQFLTPEFHNKFFVSQSNLRDMRSQITKMGADPDEISYAMDMVTQGKSVSPGARAHVAKIAEQDPGVLQEYARLRNNHTQLLIQSQLAHEKYMNLAGEAEAYMVQDRHETGDHTSFPPSTPGYPAYEKQIVIMDGKQQPQLSIPDSKRLYVAWQNPDGTVLKGQANHAHADLIDHKDFNIEGKYGWANSEGKFLSPEEATAYVNKTHNTDNAEYKTTFHKGTNYLGSLESNHYKQLLNTPGVDFAPVDHDPFNSAALVPVEHDPWLHTAEPISHDPFATSEEPTK